MQKVASWMYRVGTDVGDVAGPVGPTGVVGQLGVGGLVQPGADAAALVFKGRAQLTHHQRIGDEVQDKHKDPAEDDLRTVKVHKAVGNVAEAPDRRKGHEGKGKPRDLCGFFFVRHADNSSLSFPHRAEVPVRRPMFRIHFAIFTKNTAVLDRSL